MKLRWSLLALLLAGCLDALDPQVGTPLVDRCVNQDSDPRNEVSFSRDILPIFKKEAGPVGCTCHQPTDPNPVGFEQTGLDLSSYTGLRTGGSNSMAAIVIPGQPCESILWQKIGAGPPFGARMPFSGPPFLSDAQRRLIADWIAEGAPAN